MGSNDKPVSDLEVANSRDGCQAASEQDIELMGVQTNVTTREDVPPDGGRFHSSHHI